MNSQDLSGLDPFSFPFMGLIQELDDSLAAAGQSIQQRHTSWVFMEAVVLSSLQKHWCISFHNCLTVVFTESSLGRSCFPQHLNSREWQGQSWTRSWSVVVGKQQSLKCHFAKNAPVVPC